MTKIEIREIIEQDNGRGFCLNLQNLNGYTFVRNSTFVLLELLVVQGTTVCVIKYIHSDNWDDFITTMVHVCNFLMGNNVSFISYKEKRRSDSERRMAFLKSLNFRVEIIKDPDWKYDFECPICHPQDCSCPQICFYK